VFDGLEDEDEITYDQFSAALKQNMRLEPMLKGFLHLLFSLL